jgi:hypothetical protein
VAKYNHWVQVLYEQRRSHYAGMHARMKRADRLFDQYFDGLVDVPYEVRIFKSSTASNIVEGFRNQIRTNEPTVDFRPYGTSVMARKHAVLMQKWGYGQLRKERNMAILDPNLQLGFDMLLRGAGCKKIVVDIDSIMPPAPKKNSKGYEDWEFAALDKWPFVVKTIDPLLVFPSTSTRKPLPDIIERQIRTAEDVSRDYPQWQNPDKKRNPSRKVEWLEYWSDDKYVTIADGNVVFEKENPYGFVPYIFDYSGLGKMHEDGDPMHMAVGILTHIAGELEEEVRLKTAISVQTQMHVFPPILTIEDPKKVAAEFGVGPGKVIRHPPGHEPKYMEYPAPNENMYRFLEVIHSNIARVNSAALSGGRESGVRFGVLQAQMIGQALTTIFPILTTLDSMATATLNMMLKEAKALEFDMAVEGTQEKVDGNSLVKHDDFTHANFDVTFEAVDPAENDRALLVGMSLRRNGDLSRRALWKKYAKHVVEDPDEEEINLMEEKVLDELIASGQLGMAVISEDVQAQMQEQITEGIDQAQQLIGAGGTQNRRQETVPEAAQAQASQLETISGRPGQMTIPNDIAQQGMAAASPTRSGVPSR